MDKNLILTIITAMVFLFFFKTLTKTSIERMIGSDSIKYKVKFINNLNKIIKINCPKDKHIGKMLLIVHDKKFDLFKVGNLAPNWISKISILDTFNNLEK